MIVARFDGASNVGVHVYVLVEGNAQITNVACRSYVFAIDNNGLATVMFKLVWRLDVYNLGLLRI